MAKGKNLNPADAFRMEFTTVHLRDVSEYCRQAKLSGRRSSRRSVVSFGGNLEMHEMQLTAALLSAVEQDREAKGPRLLLGEKGHMGYV